MSEGHFRIDGRGKNLGLVLYSKTKTEAPHELDAVTVHLSDKRLVRRAA